MKNLSQKFTYLAVVLVTIFATSMCLHAQPIAQIRGVRSQLNAVNNVQWQKIRQLQRRTAVPIVKPKLKPIPKVKIPDTKVYLPKVPNFSEWRFKGKTKAQIDSIKRADKEKERFFSSFLEQLNLVANEINRRDSLSPLLDNAILSYDSIAVDSLTPDFVEYAKDAIVGSPYEIVLYNSYYDDLDERNDSIGFLRKYRCLPGLESPTNAALIKQIYVDSIYSNTLNALRDRLSYDVGRYLHLYDLEPFTVDQDSVEVIISLVPTELKEANRELVSTLAELSATGNAVYNELRDVRNLRDSSLENASSLYTVRLVEMKLKLEDALNKYRRLEIPDTNALIEVDQYIHPTWHMGKYNPKTLHGLLRFLLKKEWEIYLEEE